MPDIDTSDIQAVFSRKDIGKLLCLSKVRDTVYDISYTKSNIFDTGELETSADACALELPRRTPAACSTRAPRSLAFSSTLRHAAPTTARRSTWSPSG